MATTLVGVRKEVAGISAENIHIAEAKLVFKQEYERSKALAANAFASKQLLDERTATPSAAEANLALQRAAYDQYGRALQRRKRKSPKQTLFWPKLLLLILKQKLPRQSFLLLPMAKLALLPLIQGK